jgi:hypothetical protein
MASRIVSVRIDNNKYLDFIKVAQNFKDGAELAFEFGYYNAAGVLIVHSAIALADSITIKYSSSKIKGDSHYDVIALLKNVLPPKLINDSAIDHLKKIIDQKNLVSYSGDIYHKSDITKLHKHFLRFSNWANSILEK